MGASEEAVVGRRARGPVRIESNGPLQGRPGRTLTLTD